MQTGAEKSGGLFSATAGGVSATVNAGSLAGSTVGSLEQMVVDHEMLVQARRLKEGITVTADTLALEVIRREAAGGDFIGTSHTLDRLRSGENVYLEIFDRSPVKAEFRPVLERAHEKVLSILGPQAGRE
jgi:trimethylamine--corrinoid protein Co-methyltransferase